MSVRKIGGRIGNRIAKRIDGKIIRRIASKTGKRIGVPIVVGAAGKFVHTNDKRGSRHLS
jgi:hypothetical protein